MSSYKILEKKRERIGVIERMQKLNEIRAEDFKPENKLEWERLELDANRLESEIRAMELEKLQAQDNAIKALEDREGRSKLGQIFRGLANPGDKTIDKEIRDLTSSGASAIINDPVISEMILQKLTFLNPLADLGATFLNVENNTVWPRVTALPSATWQATESTEISADTALTIEGRKIDYSDLAVRVDVHNSVLRDSGTRADRLIENAAMQSISDAVLQAVLHGSGTSGEPTGIFTAAGVAQTGVNVIDNAGAALIFYDQFIEAFKDLLNAGVPTERIGVLTAPETWAYIHNFKESTNAYLKAPDVLNPMNWKVSNAVLTTYNTNTETAIFIGDWTNVVVATQPMFSVRSIESRASYLQTSFIFHMRMDLELIQPETMTVIKSVPLT